MLTSKAGHTSVGFGAWPNWNHLPVPEYSMVRVSFAFRASADACSDHMNENNGGKTMTTMDAQME